MWKRSKVSIIDICVNDIAVPRIHLQPVNYFCSGCPRLLRTDLGTENSVIAVMQPMLRHNSLDNLAGVNSHRYGASTSNQVLCFITHGVRFAFSKGFMICRGLKHFGIS